MQAAASAGAPQHFSLSGKEVSKADAPTADALDIAHQYDCDWTKVELFTKAAMVSQAEADVTLYQITGAKCGQATLDEELAGEAWSLTEWPAPSAALQAVQPVSAPQTWSRA